METQDDLQRELNAGVARNRRSGKNELVARLTASERPSGGDVTKLLDRILRRHEELGPPDVSEATLRDLRDDGRP